MDFPDVATLNVQNATQIYPKLVAFKDATRIYKLPTNWNYVVIVVEKHDPDFKGT